MAGLLPDTLKILNDTAVKASDAAGKVAIIRPPSEPEHVYLTVNHDGTVTRFSAEPEPRNHLLVTLEQVAAFVASKGTESDSAVWFDRSGIVVITDDKTRRDQAALKLNHTPQCSTLVSLEASKKKHTLRDFRRLMRVDLAGCTVDRVLLNWLASVKFSDSRTVGSSIKQGKESLGREIEQSAVSQSGECPETVTLRVRIFDDPSLIETWPLECAVEIDLDNQEFQLIPLPGQLHDAIENEVGAIGKALAETIKCPVFRGKP